MRWNRLFWAFALSFMPITLLLLDGGDGKGLETLQAASIVGGAPLLIVALMLCMSIVKVARFDLRNHAHFSVDHYHIDEFVDDDPWTESGSWEHDKSE